ncbi:MAG TPA: TRAP transporter fused permease subunit [Methylomirabilota bacterium]|nr:TRAP transporter fused permease subunit [Methylomirabilota bacterium]
MAAEPALMSRHRALPPGWQAVLISFSTAGTLLAINQLFNLNFFAGVVLLENRYLYLLLSLFFSLTFLIFPAWRGAARDRVPWYDALLFAAAVAAPAYFAWHGLRILEEAWDFRAPIEAVWVGAVLWLLVLEGARRAGGIALFVLVFAFSLYPVVAGDMPGPISGFNLSFADTLRYHTMSVEAVLGIPMRVFGTLIIGFIIFGEALQVTGGGRFFNDLAMSMLGAFRGGPAKVSVVASGLFGSMSGSVVSNIVADGAITIPMMKRMGFRGEVAAAVEATASTGGALTPPVMGATAFVMASILGISYIDVAIAAAIPSLLFYLSLYFQVDAYSARHGLRGLPRLELPRFGPTLRFGWFFLLAFAVLVFLLVNLRREAHAPFFATALLLLLAMVRRGTRFSARSFLDFLAGMGRVLAELVTILAAVGLIIGALAVTGVAGTFSSDMIRLAGGNVFLLLVLGALACFVLGMGMTMTAAYVFLAVVLAPALIQQGLNAVAVHLFIMYWAMLSYITPPVAIGAYAAASIAHCGAMRTGFEAMRFGAVKYILPFFFVYNPLLVAQDATALGLLWVFPGAALGVGLLSYGLQGYALGIGALAGNAAGLAVRVLFVVSGLLLAAPEPITDLIGLGLATLTYGALLGVAAVRSAVTPRSPVRAVAEQGRGSIA